jgi:signal transduction histidine kinase/CheY-like chemotaxis protein
VQACKYHQQSLDVFIALKDTNSILSTMNYLGKAYLDAADTLRAMKTFENELLLATENKKLINKGFAYEGLGRCYQNHSLDSSIYYFKEARGIWGTAFQSQAATNYLLMAETYLTSGPEYFTEAEECLQQCFDLLLYSIGNGQDQLRWCFRMAELYMATKQYDNAKEYLDLSLKMCLTFLSKHDQQQYVSLNNKLEFGILLKEYMEKIYHQYHNLDIILQDKDAALDHFMLATAWSDSVSNDHAWKKVAMIQGQFETEKTQNQISLLEKDNEVKNLTLKKSRIYLFGLGALVLIIILAAIIFIRNRKIRAQYAIELERVKSEKLQELDRLKSRFFANRSHEVRTPLTLIMGPLNRILSKSDDENDKKDLGIAKKYAGNLQNLINNLLSISKLESGKMLLQASETDIVKLIRIYLQAFESLANQKNISLKFTSESKETKAYIDREKFEQILNNLLSNAFKFTNEGGRIELTVDSKQLTVTKTTTVIQPEEFVLITVSDTGQGIASEKLPHIFDRFYQVEQEDSSYYEGTGIGLALTKELVELHHGKITVESEAGKGSTFTILLPLGEEHLKPEEIVAEKPEKIAPPIIHTMPPDYEDEKVFFPESSSENNDNQAILLIVEDNADMRSHIRKFFENNFQIIEAIDGVDGYKKSTEHIPDIIISDVMMPNMDGNEFCRKVKIDERTSHIPVILLTARASKESRIEGLETGADDFITKPFDGEELQVRVENLIKQRQRIRKLLERKIQNNQIGIQIDFEDSGITSMDEQFLQKVIEIVKEQYADPQFNTTAFGQAIGLGRIQLNRKIKALTGQTTVGFIRTYRLNRAAELIKKESATIAEIAYDVGFNNPSYFTECFRQYFGKLPSEFTGNH